MFRSLLLGLILLSNSVFAAQIELKSPEQEIIYLQLKEEAEATEGLVYTDDALKSMAIALAEKSPSSYYHQQSIIDHLRDKLIMLQNDGAFVPSQRVGQDAFLPQDGPIVKDNQIINEDYLNSETLRYVTNKIHGYDNGKLGLEIKRSLKTVQNEQGEDIAQIVLGLRIFATENFNRAVESTAVVLTSDMDAEAARLKMDQAINTLARKTGKKLSSRFSPEFTNNILTTVQAVGSVAMISTMIYVVRRLIRRGGKKMPMLLIGSAAAWVITIASYALMKENGDLQFLGKLDEITED